MRQGNEDYLGHACPARPSESARTAGFLRLADGVGGHDLGEVASRTAVESVTRGFSRGRRRRERTRRSAGAPGAERQHAECIDAGARLRVRAGASMATTIVACALRFDRAAVAHVGDSRCYLIRRGQTDLLTRDHTVANEHVRLGILSAGRLPSRRNAPYAQPLARQRVFVAWI